MHCPSRSAVRFRVRESAEGPFRPSRQDTWSSVTSATGTLSIARGRQPARLAKVATGMSCRCPRWRKEQIAEHRRWNGLAIDQLNFLTVLHQSEFQLPGLFPALDSMAEGDPSMGQVVLGGVIVGRGQQPSRQRSAGERRAERKWSSTASLISRSTVDCTAGLTATGSGGFEGRLVGTSHHSLLTGPAKCRR